MSTQNLRFPSGVSVQQAKKDAKRLSKQIEKPLYLCLDLIASRQGFPNGWAKAMACLPEMQEELARCYFELPLLGGDTRRVYVEPSSPFIVIAADFGMGKTILALELARQALAQNLPVTYVAPPIDDPRDSTRPRATSQRFADALSRNVGLVLREADHNGWDWCDLPVPPRGGLLIVDDADFLHGIPDTASTAISWAKEHGVYVAICFESVDCQSDLWGRDEAPIGLRLEGSIWNNGCVDPARQVLLDIAKSLSCKDDEYAQFVVSNCDQSRVDIVHLPLPPLAAVD